MTREAQVVCVRTNDPAETKQLAATLEPLLDAGDVLLLSGDLGAGKTTFIQGLATALGIDEPVTSPTFTLAAQYASGGLNGRERARLMLHHLDVYRLENPAELVDLDLDDLLQDDAVICIEWGERVAGELSGDGYLAVEFRHGDAANAREVTFTATGERWQSRVRELESQLAQRRA